MKQPKLKKASLKERKAALVKRYGEVILGGIAHSIEDECRRPFESDGSLTEEGKESALEIVHYLLHVCRDSDMFFNDITEDVLSAL